MLPGAVRFEQFRGVFLRLIQFSTVFLPVNGNLNRNAVMSIWSPAAFSKIRLKNMISPPLLFFGIDV
jgi:hypothetical protein